MNKENVITLENPVKRGEQVIEKVTLRITVKEIGE